MTCMPIETFDDLVVYSPCNHFYAKSSVQYSCTAMLSEGMGQKVLQCPDCIASAAKEPGSLTLDELGRRDLVDSDQVTRLRRQLLRLETMEKE